MVGTRFASTELKTVVLYVYRNGEHCTGCYWHNSVCGPAGCRVMLLPTYLVSIRNVTLVCLAFELLSTKTVETRK